MSTETWQLIAVAVMLLSLPLLAWGGNDEVAVASVIGAIVFALGAGALTALRFAPPEKD